MNDVKPRVRFAPSPTGQLHLGGARTALFNWLYARKHNGQFLLRIEDTDKIRSKQEYTDQICDSLKWLGLNWDEEIIYQSQRLQLYNSTVNQLLEGNRAYRCFCSKEKIATDRAEAETKGGAYFYPGTCRNLSNKEIQSNLDKGLDYSIRIRIPNGETVFNDIIYGLIKINNNELDDFIIARTDGTPVYNLVVVVDDNEMGITHVIRGEDHISNTHKQIIIYNELNIPIPTFAHLPMILGPDKKRLSKRHGATGVQEYHQQGFLPEALNNYLALLGWNPGTEQEIFILDELINEFSISRVQKKSAVFDEKKLQWVSGQHFQSNSAINILENVKLLVPSWNKEIDEQQLISVVKIMKDRIKSLNDLVSKTDYFFNDPTEYDKKAARKQWKDYSVNALMENFVKILSNIDDWNHHNIEQSLRHTAEKEGISAGKIIHPTRLALSGISSGPSLFELMELLGKQACIRRIQIAINKLPITN